MEQAENLASTLFDTALSTQDNPNTEQDLKNMKFKIFDVCKLIYEEQREAGAQLQMIERKIEQLKSNFKRMML